MDNVPFYRLLQATGTSLTDFIYGEWSMGKILEDAGNHALPSPPNKDAWPKKSNERLFEHYIFFLKYI